MDRDGRWRLSPAFDITWAHNSEGRWMWERSLDGGKTWEVQWQVDCTRRK